MDIVVAAGPVWTLVSLRMAIDMKQHCPCLFSIHSKHSLVRIFLIVSKSAILMNSQNF